MKTSSFLISSLTKEEKVISWGKVWHLVAEEGILGNTWKPGHLYLTNKGLYWLYDFGDKIAFHTSLKEINAVIKKKKDVSPVLKNMPVLDVVYIINGAEAVASFSGNDIDEWEKVLNEIIVRGRQVEEGGREKCPRCRNYVPVKELLEKGCLRCGWVRARHNKKLKIKR